MAFPKTDFFPISDQQFSAVNRALGYPARTYILRALQAKETLQVQDLVRMLPVVDGTISEHLRKLRSAGLVQVEVKGLANVYSLDKEGLKRMYQMQQDFMKQLELDVDPAAEVVGHELGGMASNGVK